MKRIAYSSKGDYEQLKQQERDNYFNDESGKTYSAATSQV